MAVDRLSIKLSKFRPKFFYSIAEGSNLLLVITKPEVVTIPQTGIFIHAAYLSYEKHMSFKCMTC